MRANTLKVLCHVTEHAMYCKVIFVMSICLCVQTYGPMWVIAFNSYSPQQSWIYLYHFEVGAPLLLRQNPLTEFTRQPQSSSFSPGLKSQYLRDMMHTCPDKLRESGLISMQPPLTSPRWPHRRLLTFLSPMDVLNSQLYMDQFPLREIRKHVGCLKKYRHWNG